MYYNVNDMQIVVKLHWFLLVLFCFIVPLYFLSPRLCRLELQLQSPQTGQADCTVFSTAQDAGERKQVSDKIRHRHTHQPCGHFIPCITANKEELRILELTASVCGVWPPTQLQRDSGIQLGWKKLDDRASPHPCLPSANLENYTSSAGVSSSFWQKNWMNSAWVYDNSPKKESISLLRMFLCCFTLSTETADLKDWRAAGPQLTERRNSGVGRYRGAHQQETKQRTEGQAGFLHINLKLQ